MKKLIISIFVCQLAGIIGSVFTTSSITDWYAFINKPSFSPPNWLFGPVWVTLYALMGVALYLIWRRGLADRQIRFAFWFFIIHLLFNAVWSIIFFGLHNIGLALADILIILGMIIVTMRLFWPIDRRASYLLIPYLAWVSFATILNYSLWMLN